MPSATSTPESPQPTKAGIVSSSTGERHIPSSTRSDGSKRKEIKIRPGYKPPEDVEVYKNRTAQVWKNRGSGGIPGATALDGVEDSTGATTNNKNAKRREARKKAKAIEESGDTEGKGDGEGVDRADWRAKPDPPEEEVVVDEEAEKEKKARNLKKKLRQARELREKKDHGEALLPEQFEKVIKINELIRQLDMLGFDGEGEKKKKEEP